MRAYIYHLVFYARIISRPCSGFMEAEIIMNINNEARVQSDKSWWVEFKL